MRLTIVDASDRNTFMVNQLIDAARHEGVEAARLVATSPDVATGRIKDLIGDCVLWRNSNLSNDELLAGGGYLRNKIVMNTATYARPNTSNKNFQAKFLEETSLARYVLPTYKVKNSDDFVKCLSQSSLVYPVVLKPANGVNGKGISLIKGPGDLDKVTSADWQSDLLLQPYVENDGDYRVFVVGGIACGVMKRTGNNDKGDFVAKSAGVNKGPAESGQISDELRGLATQVASALHLEYAGVDIVKDSSTGDYYLLEANVSGGWQNGYNDVTGDDVPAETILWFIERDKWVNQKLPLGQCLDDYLQPRLKRLTAVTQKRVKSILNFKEKPSDKLTELEIRKSFFNTTLEDKLRFVYERLIRQATIPKITDIILGEAENSVSWAGNFLVDNNDKISTGLSTAHTLESGAPASAYYIAIQRLLAKR